MALPGPESIILNNIIFEFLWDGRSRIIQSMMLKQYCEGGFCQSSENYMVMKDFQKESWW